MSESLWVSILSVVWLLLTAAGMTVLALGVRRGSRLGQWLEKLGLRWVLIAWLLVMAAARFVNMALAMTDDDWAGRLYLRQGGSVDVALAEIAGYGNGRGFGCSAGDSRFWSLAREPIGAMA